MSGAPQLKAVFFGAQAVVVHPSVHTVTFSINHTEVQRHHNLCKAHDTLLNAGGTGADLDDTLVLTGEADLKAYADVAALAEERFPDVRPSESLLKA